MVTGQSLEMCGEFVLQGFEPNKLVVGVFSNGVCRLPSIVRRKSRLGSAFDPTSTGGLASVYAQYPWSGMRHSAGAGNDAR